MSDEKIALYFTPANEGDHVIGLPARDLTETDVAEIKARNAALLFTATTPHPATGHVLYQTEDQRTATKSLSAMTRAELNDHATKQGIASPESLPNKEAVIAALNAPASPVAVNEPPTNDASDDNSDGGDAPGEG